MSQSEFSLEPIDPQIFDILSQLNTVEIDPVVENHIRLAKQLESVLNSADAHSDDELTKITIADLKGEVLAELAKSCPFYLDTVHVSGKVMQPFWDDMENKYRVEEVNHRNSPMIMSGFATMPIENEWGQTKEVVGYTFYLGSTEAVFSSDALVDQVQRLHAFAQIGEVSIKYMKQTPNVVRSLQNGAPNLVDQVDELIGNADDAVDAMRKLGGMTISPDRHLDQDTLFDLLVYVENVINLDKELPYEIVVQGLFQDETNVDNGSGERVILYFKNEPASLLVRPAGFVLAPRAYIENKQLKMSEELYWHIDLDVFTDVPNAPMKKFRIGLRNIKAMKSIRNAVYGDTVQQ